jgi:hypothetical protein
VTGWPSQNFTFRRSVNTIVVGLGLATVARPGWSEPPGAWRSSDSHISEPAVNSGKPYEKSGSSDMTSRLVAQTTELTGLTPAGVIATRPLTGDISPADEPALLADRPQADATSADATATAMTARHFPLLPMSPPQMPLRPGRQVGCINPKVRKPRPGGRWG